MAVSRGRVVGGGSDRVPGASPPMGGVRDGSIRSIGTSRDTPAPGVLKEIGSVGSIGVGPGSLGKRPQRLRRLGHERSGSRTAGDSATSLGSDTGGGWGGGGRGERAAEGRGGSGVAPGVNPTSREDSRGMVRGGTGPVPGSGNSGQGGVSISMHAPGG